MSQMTSGREMVIQKRVQKVGVCCQEMAVVAMLLLLLRLEEGGEEASGPTLSAREEDRVLTMAGGLMVGDAV